MADEPLSNALDPAIVLAVCGGHQPLLRQLIESCQARFPQLLTELRTRAHECDRDKLHHAAHALRGVVATFSTSLAAAVEELEQSAASEQVCPTFSRCEEIANSVDDLSRRISSLTIGELERLCSAVSSAGAARYDEIRVPPRPATGRRHHGVDLLLESYAQRPKEPDDPAARD